MFNTLFWLYLTNSIFLINHEIDSAYWNEWNLFKIKGGISLFLILHFPVLFFVLYGLLEVFTHSFSGLIYSLILSLTGLFAFTIHIIFIKQGHNEFKKPVSIFILIGTLLISSVQLSITVILLFQ